MIKDLSNMSTVLSRESAPSDVKQQSPSLIESGDRDRLSLKKSLIAEISNLLEVIRGSQPGIDSLKGKKLQKRMAREMSLYFRQLGRNIPYSDLTGYLERNAVVKEAITPDEEALRIASEVTEEMSSRLDGILRRNIEGGYTLGATQATQVVNIEPTFALIDDGAVQWMNKRSARMVTKINKTTRDDLARVLTKGARQGDSVAKLARSIRKEVSGMADISKGRAFRIANTEMNEAMSESSLRTYDRLGIAGKSWATVGDDRVSEDCQENEAAGVIPMNEAFPGGTMHPPQHPDAVFSGFSFYPYGSLSQMVTSRYDGPSITIEAERIEDITELPSRDTTISTDSFNRDITGEHNNSTGDLLRRNKSGGTVAVFPKRIQLTIGSNHPVLTRRGFVNAQFLTEGDELLYDGRCKLTAGITKSDFKQAHLIEDIFTAISAVFGYTDIPAASDYFHGDESFCNSEIKVIRPSRNLLPIMDISPIEHLSKCNLTGAYADTKHVAGCSTCQSALNSIFATTPSSMGSSSHVSPLLRRESSPSFFHSYRLVRIHSASFSGMAFDASTSTELYNIGGLVVKNCRCTLVPETTV